MILEQKTDFMSKYLKSDQNIKGLSLPYCINLFNDLVQPLFSLMSHILGLDYDRLVSEVMLVFLVKFSWSEEQIKCLNFE